MINKNKLQLIIGSILLVTFVITGCNNGESSTEVKKDATETKTVIAPAVKDSMDSIPGNVSPTPGGN